LITAQVGDHQTNDNQIFAIFQSNQELHMRGDADEKISALTTMWLFGLGPNG
jgi:hypothetical protein